MSKVFDEILRPILFCLPAETAHELGILALRLGLVPKPVKDAPDQDFVNIKRFGLPFRNPVGVAAGFDKNGVVVDQLADLGFGFVEVGTVTFKPQTGNERPRLFRLPKDKALINRLGFNNHGAKSVVESLGKLKRRCVVGVNIGKNKDVPNDSAIESYVNCFELVHPVADYVTINVSSPNTPSLRELQQAENLERLLIAIQKRNDELGARPLLIKIAPDLTQGEIEAVVDICVKLDIAGIIATNTTVSRGGLKTANLEQLGSGGLSGKPLTKRSTEIISAIYKSSAGKMPIIGVGGIFTSQDAFEKIAAGACLLQAYTGFIYSGPSFARGINKGLLKILKERGFPDLNEAVGSAVR